MLKKTSKKKILFSIFLCLITILFIFILILSFRSKIIYERLNYEKNFYDDDVLTIYSPIQNPNIYIESDITSDEKEPYYFSSNDLEKISENENVEVVEPLVTDGSFITVYNPDYTEYPEGVIKPLNMKDTVECLNSECELQIEFSYPNVKKSTAEKLNFKTTGTFVNSIIYGEIPKDNSKEIMVDKFTALYYMDKMELNSLDELIGKSIDFDIYNLDIQESFEDIQESDFIKKESYIISGIYEQNWNYGNIGYVYMPYSDNEEVILKSQLWNESDSNGVNRTIEDLSFPYEDNNFPEIDKQELVDDGGYKYPGFYIQIKDKENMGNFTKLLLEYDPNLYIKSNYQIINSNSFMDLKNIIIRNLGIIIFLMILEIILIRILYKLYIDIKNK